jgi:putative Holliday junction resolvase
LRTLGIDYGARRIGLAISDAGGSLATPLDVLRVSSPELAYERILEIIRREAVQQIVIGLPLNMDGTIGSASRSVTTWAEPIAARSGRAVLFVDERLSSFSAEQSMIDRKRDGAKITRKAKKKRLDAHAAARFLQDFLDGKLLPISPSSK